MAVESHGLADTELYISGTRRRMDRAVSGLLAIRRADPQGVDDDDVVHQLRQQEMASRWAGCGGIAGLCRKMEESLTWVRTADRRALERVVDLALGFCRCIRRHAYALAKDAVPARPGHTRRRIDAAHGNLAADHSDVNDQARPPPGADRTDRGKESASQTA